MSSKITAGVHLGSPGVGEVYMESDTDQSCTMC